MEVCINKYKTDILLYFTYSLHLQFLISLKQLGTVRDCKYLVWRGNFTFKKKKQDPPQFK